MKSKPFRCVYSEQIGQSHRKRCISANTNLVDLFHLLKTLPGYEAAGKQLFFVAIIYNFKGYTNIYTFRKCHWWDNI